MLSSEFLIRCLWAQHTVPLRLFSVFLSEPIHSYLFFWFLCKMPLSTSQGYPQVPLLSTVPMDLEGFDYSLLSCAMLFLNLHYFNFPSLRRMHINYLTPIISKSIFQLAEVFQRLSGRRKSWFCHCRFCSLWQPSPEERFVTHIKLSNLPELLKIGFLMQPQ